MLKKASGNRALEHRWSHMYVAGRTAASGGSGGVDGAMPLPRLPGPGRPPAFSGTAVVVARRDAPCAPAGPCPGPPCACQMPLLHTSGKVTGPADLNMLQFTSLSTVSWRMLTKARTRVALVANTIALTTLNKKQTACLTGSQCATAACSCGSMPRQVRCGGGRRRPQLPQVRHQRIAQALQHGCLRSARGTL